MPQELDSRFQPDESEDVDSRFTPDPIDRRFTPDVLEAKPEDTGLLGKLTQPLTTAPSRFAESIASSIDEPALERSPMAARVRGFGAGAIQGIGDLVSGMTSPLDLGLMLTGGSAISAAKKGLTGAARGLRTATRVGGGAVGLEGAHRVATAEDPGDIGQGLLEIAGGIAGTQLPKVRGRVKPSRIAPPKTEPIPRIDITPADKLRTALDESVPLNDRQKAIYERGIREKLAKREEVTTPGVAGLEERRAALGGKYEKVEITPLSKKLSEGDLNNLIDEIEANPKLLPLQRDNAAEGMMKLYNGNVPQPNEIRLMREVFGGEVEKSLTKIAGKQITLGGKVVKGLKGLQDLQRSLLTSYDFSGPGRQGKNFISYPEYWKAFPDMFKSWGSEALFEANHRAIMNHPNFIRPQSGGQVIGKSIAERAELSITDLLTRREEIFRSRIAEKIPGVRMSERAYVGFLNKLRGDMFNRMVKDSGPDVLQNNIKLREIGHLINDFTGRGRLPEALEKHATLMNNIFFAPRLHAGKIRAWGRVFNPRFYATASPTVRKTALRSLLTSTGFGLLAGELFKLAGADVDNDPRSSDFRKIRIGNTRVDPFGGDQQYAVVAARLLTGKSVSSTSDRTTDIYEPGFGEQSAGNIMADFLANRLAPIPSMAVNLMFNRSYGDEDFGIQSELVDKTVPIMVQDIMELAQEDPKLLPLAIPGMFGVGLQTYGR